MNHNLEIGVELGEKVAVHFRLPVFFLVNINLFYIYMLNLRDSNYARVAFGACARLTIVSRQQFCTVYFKRACDGFRCH